MTLKELVYLGKVYGACSKQQKIAEKCGTIKELFSVDSRKMGWLDWLSGWIFMESAWKKYRRIERPALAEYYRVRYFKKNERAALMEYNKTIHPVFLVIFKTYKKEIMEKAKRVWKKQRRGKWRA